MTEEASFNPVLEVGKNTSDIIASLIILLISGAGFLGGYFQNDYSAETSELYNQAADLREEANEILSKVDYYMEQEVAIQQDVDELYHEIFVILHAWFPILNVGNNISEENIRIVNITSTSNIQSKLWAASQKLNESIAYQMYWHFEVDKFTEPMFIHLTEGKEPFNISKDLWDRFYSPLPDPENPAGFEEEDRTLYEIVNSSYYLTTQIFWEELPMLTRIMENVPKSFFIIEQGLLNGLMHEPYFNRMGDAFEIEGEAMYMEEKGNKFSFGVSIITVAIILSTTMANRLNEKKVYDRINLVRSDLLRNSELGKSKGDKFAIPVIIFALIISALGLLWGYIDFL
ncbi:MAG: hypothetical protein ACTSYI_06850 [Promethearchaeota archaeon]